MNDNLDVDITRKKFFQYWINQGHTLVSPMSIIPPPTWQATLFVNSGLIRYLEIVNNEDRLPHSLVACQPCIKLGFNDLSLEMMMAKDGYFTFFEQLTCGGNENTKIDWFIARVWEFLTQTIGLQPERIHVGIHPEQSQLKEYWLKAGVQAQNIYFPDTKTFVLNLQNGKTHGIYNPFYYDRGINHPLACKNPDCNINCSCGRYLELGDIGIIYNGQTRIVDHGIGLERITAVRRNLVFVADIEPLTKLRSVLNYSLNGDKVSHALLLTLTDHLRSTIVLLATGIKPNNKGRGYALRSLLRRIFRLLQQVDVTKAETIQNLFHQAANILRERLLYLPIATELINIEVLAELQKYQDLLKKGEKVLADFARKRQRETELSEEEKKFLYETYGLPPEIINELTGSR